MRRPALAIGAFLAAFLAAVAATGAQPRSVPLFVVERSTNANVVHYEARLDALGRLDRFTPVVAYWVMLAEDGRREDLNYLERTKAFGFTVKPDHLGGGARVVMVAVPDLDVRVVPAAGTVHAETTIGGRGAYLDKLYVNAVPGLLYPSVESIDVIGRDLRTGAPLRERRSNR
jgi:hypothetical protein